MSLILLFQRPSINVTILLNKLTFKQLNKTITPNISVIISNQQIKLKIKSIILTISAANITLINKYHIGHLIKTTQQVTDSALTLSKYRLGSIAKQHNIITQQLLLFNKPIIIQCSLLSLQTKCDAVNNTSINKLKIITKKPYIYPNRLIPSQFGRFRWSVYKWMADLWNW